MYSNFIFYDIAMPTSLCELERLEHIDLEWLIYAPKLMDLNELEHGQSDSRKTMPLPR